MTLRMEKIEFNKDKIKMNIFKYLGIICWQVEVLNKKLQKGYKFRIEMGNNLWSRKYSHLTVTTYPY
jgi:hypothetical protein